MKAINRFWVVFIFWVAVITFTFFFSPNVYINVAIFAFGLGITLLGCGYIIDHANKNEFKFLSRIDKIFGE